MISRFSTGPQPTTLRHSGDGTAADVPKDHFFVLIFGNTRGSGGGSHVLGVQGVTSSRLRRDVTARTLHRTTSRNCFKYPPRRIRPAERKRMGIVYAIELVST